MTRADVAEYGRRVRSHRSFVPPRLAVWNLLDGLSPKSYRLVCRFIVTAAEADLYDAEKREARSLRQRNRKALQSNRRPAEGGVRR